MSNLSLLVRDTKTGVDFTATKAFMDIVSIDEPLRYIVIESKSPSLTIPTETTNLNKPPKNNKKTQSLPKESSEELGMLITAVTESKPVELNDEGGALGDESADLF